MAALSTVVFWYYHFRYQYFLVPACSVSEFSVPEFFGIGIFLHHNLIIPVFLVLVLTFSVLAFLEPVYFSIAIFFDISRLTLPRMYTVVITDEIVFSLQC